MYFDILQPINGDLLKRQHWWHPVFELLIINDLVDDIISQSSSLHTILMYSERLNEMLMTFVSR